MFAVQRWARAFLDACAGNQKEGLAALTALADALGRAGMGNGAAKRFEKLVSAFSGTEIKGPDAAACRTVALLLRKGSARHIPELAREAEKLWEAENGILRAVLDSAFPLDAAFTDRLAAALREKTGSREVRISTRLVPELIGGCRLRIGSECLDASLERQLKKMAADLCAAGGSAW